MSDSLFSWSDLSGNTQTLDVDVVMSSTDKRSVKLTDHVVETGAVITDHVVIQPEELSFELVVTQTPINTNAAEGFFRGAKEISFTGTKLVPQTYPLKARPSQFQPGGFLLLTSAVRGVVTSAANELLSAVGLGSPDGSSMSGSKLQFTSGTVNVDVLQADEAVDRVAAVHDKLVEIMTGAFPVTVSFKGRIYKEYLMTEVELSEQPGKFGMASFKVQARAFRTVTGTPVDLPNPADFDILPTQKKGSKSGKTPDPDPTASMKSQAKHLKDGDGKGADAVKNTFGSMLGF